MDGMVGCGESPFVSRIEEYLATGNYQAVLGEIFLPDNLPHITVHGMDLITKICEAGLAFAPDHDSIAACSSSLIYIVQNYRPKEALICLLEQAEAFVNSEKFTCLLNPLQHVMLHLPKKRERTFSWVLATLRSHLKYHQAVSAELLQRLSSFDPGGSGDSLILEQDPKVRSILQTYKNYIYFYTPFVQQLEQSAAEAKTSKDEEALLSVRRQRSYLRDYLVDLLGAPLIHFDLEWHKDYSTSESESNCKSSSPVKKMPELSISSSVDALLRQSASSSKRPSKIKTDFRLMAEGVMELLSRVDLNPDYYIQWLHSRCSATVEVQRNSQNQAKNPTVEDDDEDEEIIVGMTSIVGYYHLIWAQGINLQQMPKVLSPAFVFRTLLHPITSVLKQTDSVGAIRKTISLAQSLLSGCDRTITPMEGYNYDHRLHGSLVASELHSLFVTRLCYVTVYCEDREIRSQAFQLFQNYLLAFDPQGRFDLLNLVFNTIPNDSLQGHMVTQLKQFISIGLGCVGRPHAGASSILEQSDMRRIFVQNRRVHNLIVSVCSLKQGVTTDICEHSNKIIAGLNLLRFLLLRDGHNNESGILELVSRMEDVLLEPLRKALDLSKAHYELKLKELSDPYTRAEREKEESRLLASLEKAANLCIGDKRIVPGDGGIVSSEEQKSSLLAAINTFETMKGLLAWLYEAHPQSHKK